MEEKLKFDSKGYYDAIGLDYKASDEDIKQNYRNIAKIWHPDQNDSEEALEKFQKISVAYDILKDRKKKLVYDLLSQIYNSDNFPDMFLLKPYKSVKENDVNIRALRLRKNTGKFVSFSTINDVEICDFNLAKKVVFLTSLHNWVLGWWSIKGFLTNIKSIVNNIRGINKNTQDNLRVLVHNSLAYWQEGKEKEAFLSLVQAKEYANKEQLSLLDELNKNLNIKAFEVKGLWAYGTLKILQLIIPLFLLFITIIPLFNQYYIVNKYRNKNQDSASSYYQEVKFSSVSDRRTFNDIVVSKIVDVPVDVRDYDMLYNIKSDVKVMYAPGEDFDILRVVEKGTTVRLTGYTPDKTWFRIMLDDGQMGFVRGRYLKRGIGKEIHENSKIFIKPF